MHVPETRDNINNPYYILNWNLVNLVGMWHRFWFMVLEFQIDLGGITYIITDPWSAVFWRVPCDFWLSTVARYNCLGKLWPVEIVHESIMTDRNNKLFHFEHCRIQSHLLCELPWTASICVLFSYISMDFCLWVLEYDLYQKCMSDSTPYIFRKRLLHQWMRATMAANAYVIL